MNDLDTHKDNPPSQEEEEQLLKGEPLEVEYIDHDGLVVAVDKSRDTLKIRISDEGDCNACPAARLCNAAGPSKATEVRVPDAARFSVGDRVTLRGTEQMHRRAIILATVIPSVALIAIMVAIYILTADQLAAALGGIGAMLFFFAALYVCRNKISHEFSFKVIKRVSAQKDR